MTENAFINKTKPPTDAELAAALGAAKPIWDELLMAVAQECGAPRSGVEELFTQIRLGVAGQA